MGILDEAIREHLELKRQHGAGDSELKQLEDEAFGPPARPDELMAEASAQAQVEQEPATELLSEPEPPSEAEPQAEAEPEQAAEPQSEEAEPSPGPSTEESERQAIAEQPTEFFDVEGEYASEPQSPSEEELAAEEIAEPRLAPADSLAGLESLEGTEIEVAEEKAEVVEDEDDFFDEQRLSEELDQALESPREEALPELEDDEVSLEEVEEPEEIEEPEGIEASAEAEEVREEPISEEADREEHEDLLEETPDFLEEAPEDNELWFEQKPPKDFDFDD